MCLAQGTFSVLNGKSGDGTTNLPICGRSGQPPEPQEITKKSNKITLNSVSIEGAYG